MPKKPPFSTARKSHQYGLAAVEATLVLPVLLLMLFVILDLGRAFYTSMVVANAARSAAGYGAQNTTLTIDYTGMENYALSNASELGTDSYNSTPINVSAERICRCDGNSTSIDCSSANCSNYLEVYVQVTASRDFRTLVPYPLIPSQIALSHSALIRAQ